ncbi:antitermination protein [Atlantibacter subterranea]|uniref:Antitermination protein n=1 Tax=Atlantibacter subterraneus TaxID=255519 RepID=A0A3R9EQX9_9ENTR|nr:antitermination protein [Atlantibacter subterranea]RSB64423.1 antitermination protein [Atlantibacter subterranea]RSE07787.1 antitermination protein [Atlantibacter subterranea]RSE29227.1 antitermination protein [Atlantibacter subterranea]
MNLESLPKYYSPKSPKLNDETPATGGDTLTITDVMAAQGMVQAEAPLGFNLFLAKMGIQDPQPAIEGLMDYALALRNPAMKKLSDEARAEMARCLAQFAYSDYARSAASSCECDHCNGKGVIRIMREVVKHPGVKGIEATVRREEVEELCKHCAGKGKISTACRDCSGRGTAIDKKRSLLQGVPVQKICDRCNGKGFSRLPTTLARARVARLVPDMTDYQWYNGYADVINKLVTKCWQEETYAELKLREVTR